MSWPWSQLGLRGPASLSEVRHAYAEKLKTTHPEDDPEGFQRLHSAYQLASRMARERERKARPPQPETGSPQREDDIQKTEVLEEKAGEEQNFDFDELLQGGGERPQPVQEEDEEEQDFDFDEFLQGGGERPRRVQEEDEEEQDFDFDELLQGGGERSRPAQEEKEEQDFDFDRLFAEGEAERAEARRRRAESRRRAQAQAQAWARERQKAREWTKKREQWQKREQQKAQRNIYEQERRAQFDQEQTRWQNTETILHTIDMLYNAQADQEAWEKFFQSPLFRQTKSSLDLVFGLEDFVSTKVDLSQAARAALFLAYGFDKGVARPELRPLYQMLLPAWQAEQGDKRRKKAGLLWSYIAGIALVPVSMLILISNWLPAFLLLGVLAFFGLRKGWFRRGPKALERKKRCLWPLWLLAFAGFTFLCIRLDLGLKIPLCVLAVGLACLALREVFRLGRQEGKARGKPVNKRDERWLAAITAVCLGLGMFMLFKPELEGVVDRVTDPRAQVCKYLEQDFGIPFQSIYNKTQREVHANVFVPEGDVGSMFLAGPAGERDRKTGERGYTTNYTDMMVLWALEEFAETQGSYDVNLANENQGMEDWETCGTYLYTLPYYGAGEKITALGDFLESLAQEDWYQELPPSFEIVLCSDQMKEGRLILSRYKPEDGPFDAQEARTLYEESFAHAYCGQVLKECELDRDFVHGGEERYSIAFGGMEEMRGEACFQLYGLREDGTVGIEYYVNLSLTNIYCVPSGFWEQGGSQDQLDFYKVIYQDAPDRVITVRYPWIWAN